MPIMRSYLCKLLACLGLVLMGGQAHAQHLFLDPDTTFIATGVGATFDLDLRVDANTQGIRLFQAIIEFDDTRLDTVSTALGPLFDNTPYTSVFNSYIYYDSVLETTVLRLEGLLFGPTAVVDGPGVVAEVTFITIGTGTVDMPVLDHVMTDQGNNPISSTASGAVVLIDVPPLEFNLISPELGEEVSLFTDSSLHFFWEQSSSPYPGESLEYTLDVSSRADFLPDSTVSFTTSDTTYDVPGSNFVLNKSYWYRVTAAGTVYSFQTESTPYGRSFYVREPFRPPGFYLHEPADGTTSFAAPGGTFTFVWGASAAPYPQDELIYLFEYSTDEFFGAGPTVTVDGLTDTTYTVNVDDLPEGTLYWRVLAYGSVFGTSRPSIPYPAVFDFFIGAEPGAFDLVLPANGGYTDIFGRTVIAFDWEDAASVLPDDTTTYIVSIWSDAAMNPGTEIVIDSIEQTSGMDIPVSELPFHGEIWWTVLARNRFDFETAAQSQFTTYCFMRGDLTPTGTLNVSDLSSLVGYLFRGEAAPVPVETGDLDCSGAVNVADLTFMVDYLFRGGPGPYCP